MIGVMAMKIKPCPFCGGRVGIAVCDDEGSIHDWGYLARPYSGVGYRLCHTHELNPSCPIARYKEDDGTIGVLIYDSAEEAVNAWNRRIDNG